jgi:hypothetical protein
MERTSYSNFCQLMTSERKRWKSGLQVPATSLQCKLISKADDYGQKAAIKKGRAISDSASDSSDSPPVDYSEYL